MAAKVVLPGSHKHLLPNSRPAGPVDPAETASITVRVRSSGDPKALEAAAYRLAGEPLAERIYLTHADLAQGYGAARSDLDAVERFAHGHNLVVSHRSAAERSIVLAGRLGDLLAAFPADLKLYHHAMGSYRGRRGDISIPAELDGVITGIFGFDTRPKMRSPSRAKAASRATQDGNRGVAATEYAARYNFPQAHGDTRLDGAGQTIAFIELGGGYRASDLAIFFHEIGVALPSVTAVSVDRAGDAPTVAGSADSEVMLDIEVAGAVAPMARLVVYFAPNNGDKGFIDALSAAVHDVERRPSVISVSWGSPETSTDAQSLQAYHEIFAAAGALGVTVCAASGDHGTADLAADAWHGGGVNVDHPACDDLVLGCGGTQIEGGRDVVWNDWTAFDVAAPGGGGWASGGGISEVYPTPPYQAAARAPVSLASGRPGRGVPDLAMSAVNYFTRVDTYEAASGGTSAVAPLMAALVARLNQAKGKPLGFLNPLLYAIEYAFVDVTDGTNAINGATEGYLAGPGWNACCGLGTPDGEAILRAIP